MMNNEVCLLDGNPATITDHALTASIQVRCPECRVYRITRAAISLLETQPQYKAGLARWVRHWFDEHGEPFQITEDRLGYPDPCGMSGQPLS